MLWSLILVFQIKKKKINIFSHRYLLQLHYVHGGFVGGTHSGGAQLPSSNSRHPYNGTMGNYFTFNYYYSAVFSMYSIYTRTFYDCVVHKYILHTNIVLQTRGTRLTLLSLYIIDLFYREYLFYEFNSLINNVK